SDGQLVATGGFNGNIQLWDPRAGSTKVILKGVGRPVWATGFFADGRTIVWGNQDPCPNQLSCPNQYAVLEYALRLPEGTNAYMAPEILTSQDGLLRERMRAGSLLLQHRKGGHYGYDHAVLDVIKDGVTIASIERGSADGYAHSTYSLAPD